MTLDLKDSIFSERKNPLEEELGEDKGDDPNNDSPDDKKTDNPPSHQGGDDQGTDDDADKGDKGDDGKPGKNNPDDEEDKKTPFHKHPRWQQMIADKRESDNKLATALQQIDELKNKPDEPPKEFTPGLVPKWFEKVYGDDPTVWAEYQQGQKAERETLKQEIIAEQNTQRQGIEKQQQAWDKWENDTVSFMQNDGKHEKFTNKELDAVMKKYRPTMEHQGQIIPDHEKGYEILQLEKAGKTEETKKKTKARGKIADMDKDESGGDDKDKVITPKDLKGKSMSDLARKY